MDEDTDRSGEKANAWGSGNPSEFLPGDRTMVMFDDHRYYKWDPWIEKSQAGYMRAACGDDRGGPGDLIIGEWSLQVADELEQRDDFEVRSGRNNDFYRRFWAAQVRAFERSRGWVFWTWKCNWINGFDDWRWCYQCESLILESMPCVLTMEISCGSRGRHSEGRRERRVDQRLLSGGHHLVNCWDGPSNVSAGPSQLRYTDFLSVHTSTLLGKDK